MSERPSPAGAKIVEGLGELRDVLEAEKMRGRDVLDEFIASQHASREAFEAEIRGKLRRLDRNNQAAWLFGAVGWTVVVILAVILVEATK